MMQAGVRVESLHTLHTRYSWLPANLEDGNSKAAVEGWDGTMGRFFWFHHKCIRPTSDRDERDDGRIFPRNSLVLLSSGANELRPVTSAERRPSEAIPNSGHSGMVVRHWLVSVSLA